MSGSRFHRNDRVKLRTAYDRVLEDIEGRVMGEMMTTRGALIEKAVLVEWTCTAFKTGKVVKTTHRPSELVRVK